MTQPQNLNLFSDETSLFSIVGVIKMPLLDLSVENELHN